ncbi:MAG: siderophore biosynthesis protein, partial [Hydrogenophilales bacterium 12-63-5]
MSAAAAGTASDMTQADDDAHHAYICRRVVDTLLRENVRECVSRAAVRTGDSLPTALAHRDAGYAWLEVSHFDAGVLWIPVAASAFMQAWRSAGAPLVWDDGRRLKPLHAVEDILACFAQGLPATATERFAAFAEECRVAAEHRYISEAERERWFAEFRAAHDIMAGTRLPNWHSRLLHYDRLGAFLDHPFYPTARAKLGFDADALAAYGPEFQRPFMLRWLAVPRDLYHPSADAESTLPPLWPSVEALGLPAAMAHTHALLPVHPFVWDHQL